ncbi:MAG: hypothetical protein ABSF57_07250 [Acidobacteriaceae bacterium]|jgi:hypothetical protein
MPSVLSMRKSNKGLTAKINLWALEKYKDNFNSQMARLWIVGQVTNAETNEQKKFNDVGELISILGKWNVTKFKHLRKHS